MENVVLILVMIAAGVLGRWMIDLMTDPSMRLAPGRYCSIMISKIFGKRK